MFYIYFTRIIAILLKATMPFQWQWCYQVRQQHFVCIGQRHVVQHWLIAESECVCVYVIGQKVGLHAAKKFLWTQPENVLVAVNCCLKHFDSCWATSQLCICLHYWRQHWTLWSIIGAHLNMLTPLCTPCHDTSVSSGGVYSDLFCADGLQVPTSVQ